MDKISYRILRRAFSFERVVCLLVGSYWSVQAEEFYNMTLKQKTIGMIGGVSWESTALYYKLLNQSVRAQLGGLNSAKILLYSLNYDEIVSLEREEKWSEIADTLANAGQILQNGGSDFIILCCNTLHKVAPSIEAAIHIPFLHIADAAGKILASNHVKKVGLLGTQYTMEDGFYSERLRGKFGLEVFIPKIDQRKSLDAIIYDELCQGKFLSTSKETLMQIIQDLKEQGAEAVLLGCTELGMLVTQNDVDIPIYDTTLMHVHETVHLSL